MTGEGDRDGPGDVQGDRDDRPELDIDTAFAAIVARLSAQSPTVPGPWPASEDIDESASPGGLDQAEEYPDPRPAPAPRATPSYRAVPAPEEPDDDRYIPPEPPPLPRGDLVSRLAWAAVIGGPLFLLIAALVWPGLPAALLLAALATFIGGFVTLVARMPGEPPDDRDDGAVV